MLALEGQHPLDILSNLDCSDDYAVGVVAEGTARSIEDGSETGRVKTALVITAWNGAYGRVRLPDGSILTEASEVGRIPDAMRYALGFHPTAWGR